ncbi:hypothetical protein [Microbacterium flavescens]|nr:hypothetical protein [Microbacterium flavescens]
MMMHTDNTGAITPISVAARVCASGTHSFGATQNSGFHTAG